MSLKLASETDGFSRELVLFQFFSQLVHAGEEKDREGGRERERERERYETHPVLLKILGILDIKCRVLPHP